MNDGRRERGAAAEQLAANYLAACGIKILARNLRCKAGEIDLVGLDRDVLIIVEVRQRARLDFGGAAGSVTAAKQRRILRATRYYLQRETSWRGLAMRFDVLAVQGSLCAHQVTWIKDAFRAT
ncbi:MAG TPA: YraN family protein [Steroidobacteraceae bacterium]|jgi:putative endonuclease